MSRSDVMSPREFYKAARVAADDLLSEFYFVGVSKAKLNPLKDLDFLVMARRTAKALDEASGGEEQAAVARAKAILDVDFTSLGAASRERTLEAAKAALARVPDRVLPELQVVFERVGSDVASKTKAATKDRYELNIKSALTREDTEAVKQAASSQAVFVRNEYGRRVDSFSERARKIIADGLEGGSGRSEVASGLEAAAKGFVERSPSYWDTVAGVHINRARSFSALSAYGEAGIESYRFEAVLDRATSLQCRFMHGRVFEVEVARSKYRAVQGLDDPEDIRYTQPMISVAKDEDGGEYLYVETRGGSRSRLAAVERNAVGTDDDTGAFGTRLSNAQLEARGVTVPPIHFRCRSTVVPNL